MLHEIYVVPFLGSPLSRDYLAIPSSPGRSVLFEQRKSGGFLFPMSPQDWSFDQTFVVGAYVIVECVFYASQPL